MAAREQMSIKSYVSSVRLSLWGGRSEAVVMALSCTKFVGLAKKLVIHLGLPWLVVITFFLKNMRMGTTEIAVGKLERRLTQG